MVLCTQVNKMYVIATLSVYPHRASLKNMPGHGGIRTNVFFLMLRKTSTLSSSLLAYHSNYFLCELFITDLLILITRKCTYGGTDNV